MTEEKIARINVLAKKAKADGLTEHEKKEQAELRKEYIAAMRKNLTAQLDRVIIVEPDGTKKSIKKKGK